MYAPLVSELPKEVLSEFTTTNLSANSIYSLSNLITAQRPIDDQQPMS
jgi:hypothetical protein